MRRVVFLFFLFLLLHVLSCTFSFGDVSNRAGKKSNPDSVCVKAGVLVVLKDSFFIAVTDTVIAMDARFVRLRRDPMERSKAFYDSLALKTGRGKVMSQLYRLFVRDNNPVLRTPVNDKLREKYFDQFCGRIIRSVNVIRVPVLDGNVNDTSGVGISRWGKWFNLHPQTHTWMLKGKGLIKKGDAVNAVLLADYERLVREIRSVRDARLYVIPVNGSDSVDLVMASQDYFPLRLNVDYRSAGEYSARLTDRNISGGGLEAGVGMNQSLNTAESGRTFELQQSNLFNRFFDGSFKWSSNAQSQNLNFNFNRDFQSGKLSHIGGFNFSYTSDDSKGDGKTDQSIGGIWYGHVFTTESYRWNFIPAFALTKSDHPPADFNTANGNLRSSMLWSMTLIRRNFLRSALVRNYGISEYVPVGFSLNYTCGNVLSYPDSAKWYAAIAMDWANYFTDAGYVALQLKASRFADGSFFSDVFSGYAIKYYSPLLKLGRVRCRQFADLTYSAVRFPDRTDLFNIDGPWSAATGESPTGDRRLKAGLRTVFFMPWYLYGFRFALFDAVECYSIRDRQSRRNEVFPVISAGLRTQNDMLTYGDLSVQASWYPAVKSYPTYFQITFRTFLIPVFDGLKSGKPEFTGGSGW